MGLKVLCFSALLAYLMICEQVRAQCTQPSFPSRNVILSKSSQSFPDGSNATFECVIGHKPVIPKASKSVTCQGTQWTSLELDCTRKSCGSPPDFYNGRYEKTGILFGDTITAVCDTGYMLAGQGKDRVCREQGWDGRDPVCEVVKCVDPPTIENGQVKDEPLSIYQYSQVVAYTCNNGFSLFGKSELHCSEDGTFKPDPPKCLDGCPKPEISHAIRIGGKSPPYKLGNFLDYRCEDGYTMKGEAHIVCSAMGWSPEPPQCIALRTTTTATTVTSDASPTDDALRTTTTATTVTSDASPTDDAHKPEIPKKTSKNIHAIVWSCLAVLALVVGIVCYKCCWSKHRYSKKVARNEEGL